MPEREAIRSNAHGSGDDDLGAGRGTAAGHGRLTERGGGADSSSSSVVLKVQTPGGTGIAAVVFIREGAVVGISVPATMTWST